MTDMRSCKHHFFVKSRYRIYRYTTAAQKTDVDTVHNSRDGCL